MDLERKIIAQILKARFEESELTQTQLSQLTEISTPTIHRLLRGISDLRVKDLFKICEVFGVSECSFLKSIKTAKLGLKMEFQACIKK
jgi:transcriptional regulator with XRE-family HTH domain